MHALVTAHIPYSIVVCLCFCFKSLMLYQFSWGVSFNPQKVTKMLQNFSPGMRVSQSLQLFMTLELQHMSYGSAASSIGIPRKDGKILQLFKINKIFSKNFKNQYFMSNQINSVQSLSLSFLNIPCFDPLRYFPSTDQSWFSKKKF